MIVCQCIPMYSICVWQYLWQLTRNHSHWPINNNRYDSVKISTKMIDFLHNFFFYIILSFQDLTLISKQLFSIQTILLYVNILEWRILSPAYHNLSCMLTRENDNHPLLYIDQKWRNFIIWLQFSPYIAQN